VNLVTSPQPLLSTTTRQAGRPRAAALVGSVVLAMALLAGPSALAQKKSTTTVAPTTTIAAAPSGATTTTLIPIDCKQKRQILARYERQKARALTNVARAEQRSKQAGKSGNEKVAAAMQGVIDEQEERVEVIQAAIDAVKARCP
jgi:hypothetical protein